ncbi:MAG: DCC1-like thiol-disulfide oxidoreductase family protein [Bacteroidota bacterium]|nr:DCC1-like thiol-disulfide oxidoreductase family protein [Bacteroidota bacterium]
MQAPVSNPIVLIDSECIFCNYWGNFILKYDKSKRILITVPNSNVGREIMNKSQDVTDIEKTILFKKDDQIYQYSDAVLQLIIQMNNVFLYPLLIGYLIPKKVRNWMYLEISKRRKKLMTNQCHVSNLRENERFIL